MGFAINAVHPTYWERHEPIEKPMLASAIYSQNITKELTEHKKLHSELAKIGESVRGEHLILR
jgi:hypothetical protein